MKHMIWKNKFIAVNILALAIIKLGFAYSPVTLLGLIGGATPFSRTEVIAETNAFRTSLNLVPLRENETLNLAAEKKLQDMAAQQYFAHFSPSGTSPWFWFTDSNYRYSYAGENLAFGFENQEEMLTAWANSSSHRRNLVNPKYQDIGIAVARVSIDGAESVLVVQLFGTPVAVPVPIARTTPVPTVIKTPAPTAIKTPTPAPSKTPTPTGTPIPKISTFMPSPAMTLPVQTLMPSPVTVRGTETGALTEFPTLVTIPSKYNGLLIKLNGGFAAYSLLLAIFALRLLWTATQRREIVGKAAIYGALCLAAVFLSPLEFSRIALIF